MSLQGWRKETIAILSDTIGPVAEIVVDDVLARMGIGEDGMIATNYPRFLEVPCPECPHE